MEPCILQNLKFPHAIMIMTISSSKINMYDEEIESDIFFFFLQNENSLFFLILHYFYSPFKHSWRIFHMSRPVLGTFKCFSFYTFHNKVRMIIIYWSWNYNTGLYKLISSICSLKDQTTFK